MRIRHHILLAQFLFLFHTVFSQDITSMQQRRIIAPSPDAAAFAKYGNIPVQNYTGIPGIDVPLYTITSRDISIPISLSYHASGITVEEEAGWTGLGWTLNMGGVITRQIRGGNDFASIGDGANSPGPYFYKGYPFDSAMTVQYPSGYVTAVCQKNVDPEPDIFYFNFLGRSGSFVFEKVAGNPVILTGTPIKAEKISIVYDKNMQRFRITTPDGFVYQFGTREISETRRTSSSTSLAMTMRNEESYTSGFGFLNYEDFNVTSWYLQKITSPLGEVVTYSYDVLNEDATKTTPASVYISLKNTFIDEMNINVYQYVNETMSTSCWTNLLNQSPFRDPTQTATAHIYLKEIKFKNGSVSFIKSDREDMRTYTSTEVPATSLNVGIGASKVPQKLDAIILKDLKGNPIKKFEFRYDYFNNDYNGPYNYLYKRLKLTGVRECAPQSGQCNPYYQFSYEETVKLPSKYSRAQDFWGYYNGADTNQSRVPKGTFQKDFQTLLYIGNANRQPSAAHMKAAMLNRIIYPTGGSTDLVFEPNDYYFYGSGNFDITDFEDNPFTIIPMVNLWSDGGSTDTVQTLTLDIGSQINLYRTLVFRPADHNMNPCCAPNPFSGYDPNGNNFNYHYYEGTPYVEIRNSADNSLVKSYILNEWQVFINNCVSPCSSFENGSHGFVLSKEENIYLQAGTYKFILRQQPDFKMTLKVDRKIKNPRTIPLNSQGVYAKIGGGLRIKSIINKDGITGIANTKTFDYSTDGGSGTRRSSGILMLFPNHHNYEEYQVNSTNCSGSYSKVNGKSFNLYPLATSAMGSNVGYSRVTVTEGTNGNNGKTEYNYVNVQEQVPVRGDFIYGMPNIKNTANGVLMNQIVYDAQGNKLKEEIYDTLRQLRKDIPALAYRKTYNATMLILGGIDADISCTHYQANQPFAVITDRYITSRKIEKTYSTAGGVPSVQTTDYVYDTGNNLQLTSEETTTTKGDKLKTQYTYPPDAPWIPLPMWQTNYMYNVVREQNFKNALPVFEKKITYRMSPSGKTLLDKIEFAREGSPALQLISAFPGYDDSANLQQFVNRDEVNKSYQWGYNKTFPVAEVINAQNNNTVQEFFHDNFEEGGWAGTVSPQNGDKALSAFDETRSHTGRYSGRIDNSSASKFYSHSSTTLAVSFTKPTKFKFSCWIFSAGPAADINLFMKRAGETGYYTYIETAGTTVINKWVLVEKEVTVPADVVQMNIRIDNNGIGSVWYDDIRLHPSLAQMTTYTYDPLMGITSRCDINNQVIYYEYDAFGRLMHIRDDKKNILKKIQYAYKTPIEGKSF